MQLIAVAHLLFSLSLTLWHWYPRPLFCFCNNYYVQCKQQFYYSSKIKSIISNVIASDANIRWEIENNTVPYHTTNIIEVETFNFVYDQHKSAAVLTHSLNIVAILLDIALDTPARIYSVDRPALPIGRIKASWHDFTRIYSIRSKLKLPTHFNNNRICDCNNF